MQRGVGCKRCGQLRKFPRPPREGCDAGGHNDAARHDRLSSFKAQPKTRSTRLDSHNFPAVEVGHGVTLIPQAVFNETIHRNRAGKVNATCLPKVVKCEGWSRRGDVTSCPS